ncbi:two-component response regulator [Nostoc linckia NIES-25]|nr:two-component response regulator [Nostoc linckia NIES-25]
MAKGLSLEQMASELSISVDTVKWYTSNLYSKLHAKNRTEAIIKVLIKGYFDYNEIIAEFIRLEENKD